MRHTSSASLCFLVLSIALLASPASVVAGEFVVTAGAREFKPPLLYMSPGDSVRFSKMVSHNTVSVEGLIPDGAESWSSALGENITLKLTVPGIYSYVCLPHIGFGMVGVIAVGPVTADDIATYKKKAGELLKGPYRRLLGKINKLKPTE